MVNIKPKNKIIFFFFFFSCSFFLISSIQIPLATATSGDSEYISASSILKNFKFESIGSEPIIDDGAFNNKLRFDTQSAWILYKDDVTLLDKKEIGGSTQLKYRVVLRNKINVYTNVRINQMVENMYEQTEQFLGCSYRHNNIGGSIANTWESYIKWDHWNFGDIKNYNFQNNYFSGRVKMSFDINDNPVPDSIGGNAETEYGYIAVSEAGIVNNDWGKMTDQMPEIVALSPSEEQSDIKDTSTYSSGGTADDSAFLAKINPNIQLTVSSTPYETFDSGILPDTAGSSLNPTTKEGGPIWVPEERSMTGCNIYYDLGALSPIVYRYKGTMQYTEHYLETEVYYTDNIWDWLATCVKEKYYYNWYHTESRDVALYGINRYLQVDMMVAFEVWTSQKLGALTGYYELLKLEKPEEYYDELVWSTLAGGWGGSTIRAPDQNTPDWVPTWLTDLFSGASGILIWIIIIIVVIICLYIFIRIGIPLIQRKIMRRGYY